ncbi:uncharacterized protein LOC129737599 [Uranotaenia lowii]|uniref:uncharacterized protein LOC129737599 n=1 Tax=Uranotaenia lowii TaxID=190385 RepID=UPI002479E040|nr:uncharacterized protein LOC129737599 [Uranotaenia lowii]
MRFGRPELLIESLIESVKTTISPKADKLDTLIEFGTKVQALCDHIEAADLGEHLSNPTLLKDLVVKLPAEYKMRWASYRRNCQMINLRTFGTFMDEIVADAYSVTSFAMERPTRSKQDRSLIYSEPVDGGLGIDGRKAADEICNVTNRTVCAVCQGEGHRSRDCSTFRSLTVDDRWKCIQKLDLCKTCLYDHGRRTCRNTNRCGTNGCEQRHHPLLHNVLKPSSPSHTENSVIHNIHQAPSCSLLFRIIPVKLYKEERSIDTYAFVDEGSSLTMLDTELATKLGLSGHARPLCLKWTGNFTRTEADSQRVSFEISGKNSTKRYPLRNVGTIHALDLPEQSLPIDMLKQRFKHLRNLPIEGYINAKPQLLIGVDNLRVVVPLVAREGSTGCPTAVRTRLGWCVYGGGSNATLATSFHICDCQHDQNLNETLKEYFSADETGTKAVCLESSEEDKRAMEQLQKATVFIGDRFESTLLWKYDHIDLPDSYPMALARLKCLERKLSKDPLLQENVKRQIKEYQEKGYCHRATNEELEAADPRRSWYLPLGTVSNPKKPGKVRLVWDAAATVDGVSLNSVLLKGPDQLTALPVVLFRFRQFPVAVCADIKEMYHQIRIRKEDRNSQRFLWRSDPEKKPEIFFMDVATFGSSCSPATAQFVKNSNAKRFTEKYPAAVENILNAHYVDDYVISFKTPQEAKLVSEQVRTIHKSGGFELRNFCSNNTEVLQHLGEQQLENVKEFNSKTKLAPENVLGIQWETVSDELRFSTKMREDIEQVIKTGRRPTKREILRCVMSMFDPLGLLAPYLIFGKILIQEVWRKGHGWDDPIDDETFELWRRWIEMIQHIHDVRIPRCYFSRAVDEVEIHTFVDASEAAYSCVSYVRCMDPLGAVEVALVGAKTKVAPLKPWSIPRLELQGCVLGSRFTRFLEEGHSLRFTKRVMWSDSSTALSWINSDPRKLHRFVAFRITEILELTTRSEWRWVPTKQNPADEATKWGVGPHFNDKSIWYSGPDFLSYSEDQWPARKTASPATEELRPCYAHTEIFLPEPQLEPERFSNWNRLLRTTAYLHRLLSKKIHPNENRPLEILKQNELQSAERTLFKQAQWQIYPDEMIILSKCNLDGKNQQLVDRSSSIYHLSPVLDEHGVLRVDGRIRNAPKVELDCKYPIILPKNHHVTYLLVDDYHKRFHHGNNETIVNEIRQRFHIPSIRGFVKDVVKKCQYCKVSKARPVVPRMGPLPLARLSAGVRPFAYVGVDYFGPLQVKVGRATVKRWVALFTCLTIRAVHLEVIYSLTTEACIMGIRRFIGRRGSPVEFHSDNGTNFQGAERLLREQINMGLEFTFTNTNTKWLFIPPGAPHMGGSWERMVRSIKVAISDAYNENLDDERLLTLLIEAESIVNCRPLTYLPLDSAEQEALTPNHLLLGNSTGVHQPEQHAVCDRKLLSRSWDTLQKQIGSFWKRWTLEYLPTLTKRTKWFGETKNSKKEN